MTQRTANLTFVIILLVYLAGAAIFSQVRPLDGDEGYYAAATRLVSEGQAPYGDFFYPQTPLLPYIYAPAYKIVGSSILGLRLMSVLIGTVALMFWGLFLRRVFGDRHWPAVLGLLLVALNPYFLVWNITVKTYALTNLAAFASLWAVARGLASRNILWFLLTGLICGLCLGVRLLYGPWVGFLVVFVLVALLRGPGRRSAWLGWLGLLVGLGIGLLPTVLFYLRDSDVFLFNNVRYHALRHVALKYQGDAPTAPERLLYNLTILRDAVLRPFMLLQLVLAGLGVRHLLRHGDSPLRPVLWLAAGGALVHAIAGLVPNPSHEQYFTGPLTPMLAPLLVAGLLDLRRLGGRHLAAASVAAAALLMVIDLAVLHHGMSQEPVWRISRLKQVTASIESRSDPTDYVMAFWSGYTFESGRRFVPGLENHFGLEISEHLTLEEKVKYHVFSKELLLQVLEDQNASVVVVGAWMHGLNHGINQRHLPLINEALNGFYEPVESFGDVDICIRRPQ